MMKRSIATLGCTAVLALLAVPAAHAEAPSELESYGAGSSATALVLSLLGEELGVSATSAAVGSGPAKAAADGAALLLAGSPVPGAAPSATPDGQPANESCPLEADLAEITQGALSGLELSVACVQTSATVTDGAPAAQSGSGEVVITLRGPAGALLEPIVVPLLEGVDEATDPICIELADLCQVIDDAVQIDIDEVLTTILDGLQDELFVLAEIVVAPTVSQAKANAADGVVGQAGSNGLTINLFPGIQFVLTDLLPDGTVPASSPLLSVKLGSSQASVVRHPVTGVADTSASAAQLLSITADDQLGILTEITGTLTETINGLAVEQLSCDGGVLADVVCVDLGTTSALSAEELAELYPDLAGKPGVVGQKASAARVAVLPVLSTALELGDAGVLGLSLATADAAAYAVPAEDPPPIDPDPEDPKRSLPKTGGSAGLPTAIALFGAAAAGLAIVRRTRTV